MTQVIGRDEHTSVPMIIVVVVRLPSSVSAVGHHRMLLINTVA